MFQHLVAITQTRCTMASRLTKLSYVSLEIERESTQDENPDIGLFYCGSYLLLSTAAMAAQAVNRVNVEVGFVESRESIAETNKLVTRTVPPRQSGSLPRKIVSEYGSRS
jgi:hypothetical protein